LEGVQRALGAYPEGGVVIVSHGGTIRWISAEALGFDDRRSARIRGLGNGGVVCMSGHLEGGKPVLSDLQRLDGSTVDLDDPND
jgi:broad specificity phosphatase PhoE